VVVAAPPQKRLEAAPAPDRPPPRPTWVREASSPVRAASRDAEADVEAVD